jgi:hypothetical protein
MRKPNEDDLSAEAADSGSVGDGFGGAVDLSDSTSYGDGFDDYTDYSDTDHSDESDGSVSDDDGSFGDDSGGGLDPEETVFQEEVTEVEAEAILEDMLDETYGSDAAAMVEDMEEASGMSAVEILEDITGLDLGGDDGQAAEVDALDGTSDAHALDFDVTD